MNPHLEPIKSYSLRDLIGDRLREAIFSGRMQPGQRVVEMRISQQLGVGQNAVREALQELEFQGLVAKVPKKGTFVTELSFQDLNETFTVRKELESLAVFLAREAGRPHEEDVAECERIIHAMWAAAGQKNYPQFTKCDLEFHAKLWALSGNRVLEKALRTTVPPQFSHTVNLHLRHGDTDLRPIADKHREILEYIKTHDAAACRQYVAEIIDGFWRHAVQMTREVRGRVL